MKQQIVILGPAHPLRGGGIATFNERLATEFNRQGFSCSIVSFSLQYPSFLFPGTTQYTTAPAPQGLTIHSLINSVNPFNWVAVGRRLRKWKPDILVVRFWLPFMGPALGTILRQVKKNHHTKIICIADNVIPHEKKPGDAVFTRYFLKTCDAFITLSEKVREDLLQFEKLKPVQVVPHPLYDNFGEPVPKEAARARLGLPEKGKILLFFGFIRQYKGLDLLLQAMAQPPVRAQHITLLVAGEFYDNEKTYREIIAEHQLENNVILASHFIADADVKYYLCACDGVVQPYRHATQSGVTPLAYHFNRPMIVTNVGGLPALVPHLQAGLVCAPTIDALANSLVTFYQLGVEHFTEALHRQKAQLSWSVLTEAILRLAKNIPA